MMINDINEINDDNIIIYYNKFITINLLKIK